MGSNGTAGKGKKAEWLFAHVDHVGDECLTWPFKLSNGYGTFSYFGQWHYAHRYMCELVNGQPPSDKHQAAHECGNGHKGCVNPRHLSWKTASENNYDRARHGTKNVWGRRGKLTMEQAAEIRALRGIVTQEELAERYDVSRVTISRVMLGKLHVRQPKGVARQKNKWSAKVRVANKEFHLGMFSTEADAHSAYLKASERIRAGLHPREDGVNHSGG